MKRVAIIGGGAAGCFCAVEIRRACPGLQVEVFEAGRRPMARLALTGGGRCNISNTFGTVRSLQEAYPRGARLMDRLFHTFGPDQARKWWEDNGIPLVEEDGGRLFPASMDAMDVVRKLEQLMRSSGVILHCGQAVSSIRDIGGYDAVVVTTGGGTADRLLDGLGISTEPAVPSLFSFKLGDSGIRQLSGTAVKDVKLRLEGTALSSGGDMLITDWGVSGPAVLRLSSFAARELAANGYKGALCINWSGTDEQEARSGLEMLFRANPAKHLAGVHPDRFSGRLWAHLLGKAGLDASMRCDQCGGRLLNRLSRTLTDDRYAVEGRARFKDEFVTCGGVSLGAVDWKTLESKQVPGLYFAGEVLDIDAVTGGFNLQAAWTTAYTAAAAIIRQCR